MIKVARRNNESFEELLKRFRREVVNDGVLSTLKRNRYYVKPGEKKREAKKKAIKNSRKYM